MRNFATGNNTLYKPFGIPKGSIRNRCVFSLCNVYTNKEETPYIHIEPLVFY